MKKIKFVKLHPSEASFKIKMFKRDPEQGCFCINGDCYPNMTLCECPFDVKREMPIGYYRVRDSIFTIDYIYDGKEWLLYNIFTQPLSKYNRECFAVFPSLPHKEYMTMWKYYHRLNKTWQKNTSAYMLWWENRKRSREYRLERLKINNI